MSAVAGLATDVHRCPGSGGTLVIRTPYGRNSPGVQTWTGRGYDVIAQDVRGRYGSTGPWVPYATEGPDGCALVRAVVQRRDVTPPVYLVGASYEAHAALEAEYCLRLEGKGPAVGAVVAMVPALGLWETAHDPDGTPRWRDRIGWWHCHGFTRTPRTPLSEPRLRALTDTVRRQGPDAAFPDAVYGPGAHAAWLRLWNAPPVDLSRYAQPCAAPVLLVTGQRDFFRAETLDLAVSLHRAGRPVDVVDGPWGHGLMADCPAGTATGAALRRAGGLLPRILAWLQERTAGSAAGGRFIDVRPTGAVHITSLTSVVPSTGPDPASSKGHP